MTEASQAKLTNRQIGKALGTHYESIRNVHLRTLFADDSKRGERFTVEAAGLFLDYSKNRITDETVALLCQLARECGLGSRIQAMFGGDKINVTEDRAVLHVALRMPRSKSMVVDGRDVVADVHAVLDKRWPRWQTFMLTTRSVQLIARTLRQLASRHIFPPSPGS